MQNTAGDSSMEMPSISTGINEPIPQQNSKPPFKKLYLLLVLLIFLISSLVLGFLYYNKTTPLISNKEQPSLKYNYQKALSLLQDRKTIAYTASGLYLKKIGGEGMTLLASFTKNSLEANVLQVKISGSRKYLTWNTDKKLFMLDVLTGKVFLISDSISKQSYDSSLNLDKVLWLKNNQLIETDLSTKKDKVIVSLPALTNLNVQYNVAKYNSNGTLALVRSVYADKTELKAGEILIIDLKKGNVVKKLLASEIGDTGWTLPRWFNNETLLIWNSQGLIKYDVLLQKSTVVIKDTDFYQNAPYELNPQNQELVFVSNQSYLGKVTKSYQAYLEDYFNKSTLQQKLTNGLILFDRKITTVDSNGSNPQDLITSKNFYLNDPYRPNVKIYPRFLSVGWLDANSIYFATAGMNNTWLIWQVDRKNPVADIVLENVSAFSLQNVTSDKLIK